MEKTKKVNYTELLTLTREMSENWANPATITVQLRGIPVTTVSPEGKIKTVNDGEDLRPTPPLEFHDVFTGVRAMTALLDFADEVREKPNEAVALRNGSVDVYRVSASRILVEVKSGDRSQKVWLV